MYSWLVFVHLVGVVLFAIAHGASVFVALRLRNERDPRTVAALLGTSQLAIGPMYVGLLLLGVGGLGAAWSGGLILAPWVVGSYVVLVLVLGAMYSIATPYYRGLRDLIGTSPVDEPGLHDALASRRPIALLLAGNLGLLALVWLMVLKPG